MMGGPAELSLGSSLRLHWSGASLSLSLSSKIASWADNFWWCGVRVPAPPGQKLGSLGGAMAAPGSPLSGLVLWLCAGAVAGAAGAVPRGRVNPYRCYTGAGARGRTKGGLWRANGQQEAD